MVAIVVVIVLSAGIGLAVNLFGHKGDPNEGSSVVQILGGTGLLAAFLLGIVLSGAGSSYASADKASKSEADAIDTLFESAAYTEMPFRQKIQAAAACYARAIVGPEFKSLASGKTSPVPSNWTGTRPGGIRATLLEMTPDATGFGLIQSTDAQRGNLRSERQVQSNPTVPIAIIWFMVVLIALSLGGLAYSIPRTGNKAQLLAVVVVLITFIGAMALIYNLDRPFSGVLAQKPTAMAIVVEDTVADYLEDYKTPLPCDEEGVPLTAAPAAPESPAPAASAPAPAPQPEAAPPTSAPQTALDRFLSSTTTVPG